MENIFKGLGVALVTPFANDGSVDYTALGRLVDYQINEGIDFLCVLGSTAETPCLSDEEKIQVKNYVANVVKGRVPILLGFGGNCTSALVDNIKRFDFSGVDGILSVTPFYNKPSQEGLYRHFKAVSEAAGGMRVVLYNVPGRCGVNMTAETTLRIANDMDNVVAIKEASGNLEQIGQIIKDAPKGFQVISGDDALTCRMLGMGACGVISVVGNAIPKKFSSMVHSKLSGNDNVADELDRSLQDLYRLIFKDGNPAGIKALLSNVGMIENVLRLPLVRATDETSRMLNELVKEGALGC